MANYYICTFCNKKQLSSEFCNNFIVKDKFGICNKCINNIPYTDGDHTFSGTKHVSYIISSFYYTGEIKRAIQNYKFSYYTIFSELFTRFALDTLAKHDYIKDFDIIIPIPLSKSRMRQRSYNQSALIAEKLAEHLNIAYSENILYRIKNTKKQSTLHGVSRLTNMQNSFDTQSDLTGLRILLFDDIFTTGNTLNEAAKVLRMAGAVDVVAITTAIVKRDSTYDHKQSFFTKILKIFKV